MLSSPTLCKGQALSDYVKSRGEEGVLFRRIVYVGNGRNDLCPVMRLRDKDVAAVRKGSALHHMLKEDSARKEGPNIQLAAKVVTWESGLELMRFLKDRIWWKFTYLILFFFVRYLSFCAKIPNSLQTGIQIGSDHNIQIRIFFQFGSKYASDWDLDGSPFGVKIDSVSGSGWNLNGDLVKFHVGIHMNSVLGSRRIPYWDSDGFHVGIHTDSMSKSNEIPIGIKKFPIVKRFSFSGYFWGLVQLKISNLN